MQLPSSTYQNIFSCGLSVYRKEGLYAFYVSYPTTLAMSIPYHSVTFTVYESMRKILNPGGGYDPVTHITAGGIAGGVAAAITNPIDVVKTLLQTRGESQMSEVQAVRGFIDGAKVVYKTRGWQGFFKGVSPRIMATMPSTAICWATYEYFKYIVK
jgi:solute carrier family 25 iron transporter 28/37